ncbi:hypothetical protein TNCV_2233771 [Trichonephila clavipes]|nr:hypothetical protein TNCV_2233771 [Trichonephila clavipes]
MQGCTLQYTVGDLPIEAASARTLVPEVLSTTCKTPSSNMGVRAIRRRPVPSIVALKDPHSTRTDRVGSDVVQSGRPIFNDFFQHLWPYIGKNTANVVFQMVKRLWLIRIDQ